MTQGSLSSTLLLVAVTTWGLYKHIKVMRQDHGRNFLEFRHVAYFLGIVGLDSVLLLTLVDMFLPSIIWCILFLAMILLDEFRVGPIHRILNKPILPNSKDVRRFPQC